MSQQYYVIVSTWEEGNFGYCRCEMRVKTSDNSSFDFVGNFQECLEFCNDFVGPIAPLQESDFDGVMAFETSDRVCY